MRWHAHHRTSGTGHLYQGRFKTFPLEEDEHLLAVLRYVERNPLRANLCNLAEEWRYGSAWRRTSGDQEAQSLLAPWPVPRPRQWRHYVNKPQSEAEVAAIRQSLQRGTPYGTERWVSQAAARLQLKHTLRPRGRPPKK
jgi:putative transposase